MTSILNTLNTSNTIYIYTYYLYICYNPIFAQLEILDARRKSSSSRYRVPNKPLTPSLYQLNAQRASVHALTQAPRLTLPHGLCRCEMGALFAFSRRALPWWAASVSCREPHLVWSSAASRREILLKAPNQL